ncbi:membrane protein [Antarctobacter heliothermus]|uniref:Membrane protein n=1 Tax=Antarctobacter heliothermus TaxID=74033 RepID=A0A222E4I5_9RHOB|nr:membrane protein [Antarctobacter heliothermus]
MQVMTYGLKPALIFLFITAAMATVLLFMGRDLICPCGYVSFWTGPGAPPREGSQHLFDLYSPSHLIHGLLFFGVLALVARRLSINIRFAIALIVEAGWEILENTPLVIERYRAVTVSLDYNGDSVINSIFDVIAMVVGFYLARVLPVWVSVAIVIGLEVLTAFLIRDGLALNILMLFWPLESVLQWQQGG